MSRVIADRYVLRGIIGQGGMGVVYRADDRTTGEPVALKLIREESRILSERFAREVALLSQLDNPGIVRYFDGGVLDDGEQYLVMEWVEGESLDDRLDERGLDVRETLALASTVAGALAAAHARGVVHRDLKPANLLLPRGHVEECKLIDFGIARGLGDLQRLTSTGDVIGSPGYLSPEQVLGRPASPSMDVFSFGCVLYECLTGHAVFVAAQSYALLTLVLVAEPEPIVVYAPEVPFELEELVHRMLSKDPEDRPADGAAVLAALEAIAAAPEGPRRPRPSEASPTQLTVEPPTHGGPAPSAFFLLAACVDPDGPGSSLSAERMARLGGHAARHGATTHHLVDGSVLVQLQGEARSAARLALELRDELPDVPIMLSAAASGERIADVIDRDARVLERDELRRMMLAPPAAGSGSMRVVRLSDAVAAALTPPFTVGADAHGSYLVGEK